MKKNKIKILLITSLLVFSMSVLKVNAASAANKINGSCQYGDITFNISYNTKEWKYKVKAKGIVIGWDGNGKNKGVSFEESEFASRFCNNREITADNCACPSTVTIYETAKDKVAVFSGIKYTGDDIYDNPSTTYNMTKQDLRNSNNNAVNTSSGTAGSVVNPPQSKPTTPTTTGSETKEPSKSEVSYKLDYEASPCENENIENAIKVVGKIVSIIQIVVPIILVIFVIVDIVKIIISMDGNIDAKVKKSIISRLISAVIIFFIIAIVKLACSLIGGNSGDTISCLDTFANPW